MVDLAVATYAKGDDQHQKRSPFRKEGCVWDDGNEFIEYGWALRAVTLGHAIHEGGSLQANAAEIILLSSPLRSKLLKSCST
jgi:hypothetical protein